MSRYVIIGAGAVGAGLAAEFDRAGVSYVLAGRGANHSYLTENSLRYVRPDGVRPVRLHVDAAPVLTPDDVLILAVKSQQTEAAVQEWAWRPVAGGGVAADLPIVTLQNGLQTEYAVARRFARTYAGSLLVPARYTSVGEVVSGSSPIVAVLTLGAFPGGTEGAEPIAEDLRRAGWAVQLSDDVLAWKAAKLLWSVRNGLEVLTGDPGDLADRLASEARAVLDAAGLRIADTVAERTIDLTGFGVDPASGIQAGQQSTWQSFQRGGSTEVDYLNGEVVLLGRLHGVPTPVNRALQVVLGAAVGSAPGTRTIADLEKLIPVE